MLFGRASCRLLCARRVTGATLFSSCLLQSVRSLLAGARAAIGDGWRASVHAKHDLKLMQSTAETGIRVNVVESSSDREMPSSDGVATGVGSSVTGLGCVKLSRDRAVVGECSDRMRDVIMPQRPVATTPVVVGDAGLSMPTVQGRLT